jgi:DNA polymerase elongation subunit (family B)
MEQTINGYMRDLMKTDKDYIITCDTDAFYLNIDDLIQKVNPKDPVKFIDTISETRIQPMIRKSIDTLAELCNVYENRMSMKREAIASRGIYVAGKNYALVVHNSEGVQYDPPKLKVMGLSLVKSSTPMAIRKVLKEALNLVFTTDIETVRKYAKDFKATFLAMTPNEIAFPRGVNNPDKFADPKTLFVKGTPVHVRGSLLYNKLMPDEVPISSGDKIRFLYLKMPNPLQQNIVAWPANGKIPPQLVQYIDKEEQFVKVFKQPLEIILNAIGWELEECSSLSDFF